MTAFASMTRYARARTALGRSGARGRRRFDRAGRVRQLERADAAARSLQGVSGGGDDAGLRSRGLRGHGSRNPLHQHLGLTVEQLQDFAFEIAVAEGHAEQMLKVDWPIDRRQRRGRYMLDKA